MTFRFFCLYSLLCLLIKRSDNKTEKREQEEIMHVKYPVSSGHMISLFSKLKLFFGTKGIRNTQVK